MIIITKDMLRTCTPIDIHVFANEQQAVMEFVQRMAARSKEYPVESVPGFYVLLIIVLYKIFKVNLDNITNGDILKHYEDAKSIFIRAMWHEEFVDEQPQLYRLLMFFMDCCMEDPNWEMNIEGVACSYICIMYTVLKEHRGRY